MALYTKIQFAELCGVSIQYINEYIKRQHLILSGDYIDNTIEPNISFQQKRLHKKKAEKNNPLPSPELPENLFWELAEGKDETSDYNHAAEKLAVGIMKDAEKNNLPFQLIPVCLTRGAIAEHFFDAYNFFLQREFEVLRNTGIEPTRERIAQLINYYKAQCRQSVENCIKDLENTVTEIVAEYEETKE